jgi:hypothetical protein
MANKPAKVKLHLYLDDPVGHPASHPIWAGKQLARLREYIASNGLTGRLRIAAFNLTNFDSEEITVSRFDGDLYNKIEALHARVKAL